MLFRSKCFQTVSQNILKKRNKTSRIMANSDNTVTDTLLSPLPSSLLKCNTTETENVVLAYLNNELPINDRTDLENDLKWHFMLEKHKLRKTKPIRKKKTFLTRKERRKLNLLKLPKEGWYFKELESLRVLWKQYMKENLSLVKGVPNCEDPTWHSFSLTLMKSEFIGAEIEVIRSTVPSLVGLDGTVVLETKATFQIVTPNNKLKTILKAVCVFRIILDNIKITFLGKSLVTKPSERSVKKIKAILSPDL